MCRINCLLSLKLILVAALALFSLAGAQTRAQAERDPHRTACANAQCRKAKSFLKAHYCGESPFGNGPDDGCLIKRPTKTRTSIEVSADFNCAWNQSKQAAQCVQRGQATSDIRSILIGELRHLGLPTKANGQIYFTIWKSSSSDWSVAEAYYSRTVGTDLDVCQVIVIIDQNSHVVVLRKLPFQTTDVDVPRVTQWSLLDLVDVDGDGQVEIILEGDAYEDHWLEVIGMRDGSPKTLFSGLGYYL
jgi:hypothetical protein